MAATPQPLDDRPSRARYAALAGICAVAFITYIQRQNYGVVEMEIRAEFQLTKEQSAWLSSGLFVTYALLQVPGGRLGQLWGTRRALPLYCLICSTATGLLGFAGGFAGVLAARLGMGAGQAGVFPCTTTIVQRWIPVSRRALANGSITSVMQVGAIIASVVTGLLAPDFGWRFTFVLFALPGLAWSVWFYLWFRDDPSDHHAVNSAELQLLSEGGARLPTTPAVQAPDPIPWWIILSNPTLALICAQQFFRGAGYTFYSSWFTTFLREGRHVEGLAQAGMLTTLPILATAIGSLLGGWLSDTVLTRTGSRRLARQWLSAASQLACALIVLAAYPVQDPLLAVSIISAGAFCAAIAGPISYTLTIDLGGRHVPTVFGLMNMWGNIGAFAFPHAVPWLVGEGPNANWNPVLFLFSGIYIAAAACWMAFNAEGTIFKD